MPDTATSTATAASTSTSTTMTTNTNVQGTSANAPAQINNSKGKSSSMHLASPTAEAESESDLLDAPISEIEFLPTKCIFCPVSSPTLPANLSHMRQHHGLFIPRTLVVDGGMQHPKVLAVDDETLVRYMHLVIYGDRECLYCHTQRRSVLAVQQHMMGRGHCRMDLEGSESEFLDFYEEQVGDSDVEETQDEDQSSTGAEANGIHITGEKKTEDSNNGPAIIDDHTLRLSSGKVLSHRSASPVPRLHRHPLPEPKTRHRRDGPALLLEPLVSPDHLHEHTTDDSNANANNPEPEPSSSSSSSSSMPKTTTETETDVPEPSNQVALTRTERRALTHHAGALTVALSQMSRGDRASLAHLSLAQQRATIVKQFRQQDKAKHGERRYWSKFSPEASIVRATETDNLSIVQVVWRVKGIRFS